VPDDLAPAGGGGGFSLTRKYGPLPAWGWLAVAGVGGYVYLKWRQSKAATSGTAGAGASTTYVPYNPVDYSGGGGAIGGVPWTNPSSNLGTVTSGQTTTTTPPPAPPPAAPAPPPVMPATPQAAPQPVNPYQMGQTVNAGESIVQSLFDPVFGWLNLTSKGGLYTSPEGGSTGFRAIGSEPYGGSYLGYVSTLPQSQQAAQMAQHGTFAPGGLSVGPNGAYTLTNTAGEAYSFPVQ
jgi:hypothetical protein